MVTLLKWIGFGLAGLVGLLLLAVVALSFAGQARLNRTVAVQPEAISIPNDADSLARGRHLVEAACASCHGPDLSGQPLLAEPVIGMVYAANISTVSTTHSDEELVLAIRHAVDPDGRQLFIMPAESFIHFSAEDLSAIIAYLKTVTPVEKDLPGPQLTFLGRALLGAGVFGQIFPAEYIDHDQAFHAMPPVGANAAYGEYLARFCQSCHGADLTGAQPADPQSPPAPNLTPGGTLAHWSQAEFIQTMRSGTTPYGRQLNRQFMPWPSFGKFDDQELAGLWLYLSSLPPAQPTAGK